MGKERRPILVGHRKCFSSMDVQVYEDIAAVPEARWNEVVEHGQVFRSHAYLRAVQNSHINDCAYYYPVIRDGDEILAHACVYSISTELDVFARGFLKGLVRRMRQPFPGFMMLRTLECGSPVAPGSSISVREGVSRAKVLRELLKAIHVVAAQQNIQTTLIRDFHEEDMDSSEDVFMAEGYQLVQNLPFCSMSVKWTSMQDYVASLRSSYRRKMKKREQKFSDKGGVLTVLRDFGASLEEITGLYENVFTSAREYKRERLTYEFFQEINKALGERSFVITATVGETIVGFCLLVEGSSTLYWLYCGLDYVLSIETGAYFAMLYEIIRCGIKHQVTRPHAKRSVCRRNRRDSAVRF